MNVITRGKFFEFFNFVSSIFRSQRNYKLALSAEALLLCTTEDIDSYIQNNTTQI